MSETPFVHLPPPPPSPEAALPDAHQVDFDDEQTRAEMERAASMSVVRGLMHEVGERLRHRREDRLARAQENQEWVDEAFGKGIPAVQEAAANTMHFRDRGKIRRTTRVLNRRAAAIPTSSKPEKLAVERIRGQRVARESHALGRPNAEQKKAARKVEKRARRAARPPRFARFRSRS